MSQNIYISCKKEETRQKNEERVIFLKQKGKNTHVNQ